MFQSPDYNSALSLMLSEVMEDIGVNEDIVKKRRRVFMLMENIATVTYRSAGNNKSEYFFGSQSEGTTSPALYSDIDQLCVNEDVNVMKDWSGWKQNKINYLMIRDENVTPGYCFLQLVRYDVPLPATHIPNHDDHIRDSSERILFMNSSLNRVRENAVRQGPSITIQGVEGESDLDIVYAFPSNSWPHSASNFIQRQGITRWPSSEMIRYAASNGCFVVGASSKISTHPDLEWRISTSLAERCLMHNLNITQIQCYVLMKMVLKTFLNPRSNNGLSSFMCKTVLLHCIENTDQNVWVNNNLFTCLTYCLLELHSCVHNNNCPHFMIPDNNLMAGQFNVEEKRELLKKISDIIQSDGIYLFGIEHDAVGKMLYKRLTLLSGVCFVTVILPDIAEAISKNLNHNIARCLSRRFLNPNIISASKLVQIIQNLTNYNEWGHRLEQLATCFVLPFICSHLGSTLASSCIRRNIPVSPKALTLLLLGLDSDVTSGKLKIASVFYCAGDMYRTELILKQVERDYDTHNVLPICSICNAKPFVSSEFMSKCREKSEEYFIRNMTSLCVCFLQIESNCVPRELRYEMERSTQGDMPYRSQEDRQWMDCAVIDSLPLLYFLQYKTYNYLQRNQDKQNALNNLTMCILKNNKLGHRETALNLLGQCMDQENRHMDALQYYMLSLGQRARNNAAKVHICILLAKYYYVNRI